MKKSKILLPLACLSMLLVACNGQGSASVESKSSSGGESQPSTSQPASTSSSQGGGASSSSAGGSGSGGASSSSSASSASSDSSQAAHVHDYQAVGTAVKNPDNKDVFVKECKDHDDKYIGIAFDDYSAKSADFGSTSSYNNVPEELRNSCRLLAKGSTVSWRINLDRGITGAELRLAAVYTGSDHGSKTGLDGSTVKYSIQVNGGEFADWAVTADDTYDGVGLAQKSLNYIKFATINLRAGENTIVLRQNNAGYRLLFGGEVRVANIGEANPVAAPAGYTVTFATSHAKAMVYESGKDYTKAPVESTTTKTRDENGCIAEYVAEDATTGVEEIKPQVNFQIVVDDGYSFDDGIDRSTLVVDATDPTIKSVDVKPNKVSWIAPADNYNKLKLIEKTNTDGSVAYYYRTTKVKGALTITLNAVQPVAQPTGAFRGMAKLASGDNDFLPIDLVLAADAVTSFHVNGEAVTVTSYAWDGLKSELTIVTEGAYGTVKATFKDNVFTITGLTGEAAALLDLTYAVNLSGNCQFLDCEQDTATLQQMFLRRKMGNSGWEAANADDKIFSSDNGKYGKGLSVKCWADGKIALALKNDLNIPAKNIKSVGCWIYNPSATKYSTTLYFYKGTGYSNNQQAKNIDLPAGAWTFVQCGVSGLLGENDTFQNFQFYTEKVNTTLVFDNFCLYM